jgi:DNA-binding NtrC family response regulator
LEEAKERAGRELLQDAHKSNSDNLSLLTRNLGLPWMTLYRLPEKHGLKVKQ